VEVGAKLQQARIRRGFTVAHISNVTKMSSHVLLLIEAGDFERLPGGLLTRGHLRAFASEVGLNPEEIVNEYRAEFEGASHDQEPFKLRTSCQDKEFSVPHAGLMLIIGLMILIYFLYPAPVARPTEVEIGAGTAQATTISTDAAAPARSVRIAPLHVASADWAGLQIELQPQAECWLSAVADGRQVIYRLMQAGERETINARDEILLRVGDADALTYFVNGGVGRSLGAPGEAVSVRITSDNAAEWLTNEARRPRTGDINGFGEPVRDAQGIISRRQVTGI